MSDLAYSTQLIFFEKDGCGRGDSHFDDTPPSRRFGNSFSCKHPYRIPKNISDGTGGCPKVEKESNSMNFACPGGIGMHFGFWDMPEWVEALLV